MERLIVKAPAKINLGLNIISKRDDGFHNLETIFYPIEDLFDVLIFEKSQKSGFSSNIKISDSPSGNLILKAKKKLQELAGKELSVKIDLKKSIPLGAGLGGGSSDAANTLIALNEMFNLNIPAYKIRSIALELGSDVPFFLNPVPSFAESRGELLIPLNMQIDFPILLVNPNIHISTKEAFQNVVPDEKHIDYLLISALSKKDFIRLNNLLKNDFEKYVLKKYPVIGNIKKQLLESGAFFSLLSGTGSTVYGIFENINDAKNAKELFEKRFFTFLHAV